MNALLKSLALLAFLVLLSQTVRHAYMLWLQPRTSVLDKYDQPLKSEISQATSLDELLRRYDPIRKQADQARAERAQAGKQTPPYEEMNTEPFRSERELRNAIEEWERRSHETREIRFYWSFGLLFLLLGLFFYRKVNRWAGVALAIVAFAEFEYWTSPTFFGAGVREYDRLLANKFALTAVSLALLVFVIWWWGVFRDQRTVILTEG
jgi:hypothetical protein